MGYDTSVSRGGRINVIHLGSALPEHILPLLAFYREDAPPPPAFNGGGVSVAKMNKRSHMRHPKP